MTRQGPVARFVCLTNIPSLYRLQEFEVLHTELQDRGIAFEAVFMAETEPGRHWSFRPGDWSFPSSVLRGIHPLWRNAPFHFNPGVFLYLLHRPPTWLLIGGGWTVPTAIAAAAMARLLLPNTTLLFWVEATLSYTRYSRSGWTHTLKRTALSAYDAFVVPGQCSVAYLQELFAGKAKPTIRLANFVDERPYVLQTEALSHDRDQGRAAWGLKEEIVLLCPARLIPEKGILEFLSAVVDLPMNQFTILLAGDGPLRREIAALVAEKGMRNVRILGHQDTQRLIELYALSDVLLLPSPREPYGFVAVEALWVGLPLLLSDKVGALPEVLEPDQNGWAFDPLDRHSITRAVESVLAMGRADLAKMGAKSRQIAEARFAPRPATQAFVNELLAAFPPRKP